MVIEGAFAAFVERGFMGASIDFICSKAGLSRGAFYSNFADKNELFVALYERQAERLRSRLATGTNSLDQGGDLLDQVSRILAVRDEDEFHWDIINKEFVIHALRNEDARRTLVALRAALRSDLREILDTTFSIIGVRPPGDLDEVARLAVAIHEGDMTQRGLESAARGNRPLIVRFLPAILSALQEVDDRRNHDT
jgi:AcrR family transcriptional regulator